MTSSSVLAAPTPPGERIVALDVLRGFAVLGILVMNIQSYAMIEAAYLNPAAYGDLTGINRWAWALSHVFFDQKFITIFSILFGAGIFLMTGRLEGTGRSPGGLHYRRTFWLIVIGLLHAYLLWYGDILVAYGVLGLVVFLFRRVSPRPLLTTGLVSICVPSLLFLFFGWSLPHWPAADYNEMLLNWKPSAEVISNEVSFYQGGWLQQMAHRIPTAIESQTLIFLIFIGWRSGGLMLVGMSLFKWGVLTAERSVRFYLTMMVVGFGMGLPVVVRGIARNFEADWSFDYSMFLGSQFNYWGSLLVAIGYVGGVMFIYKSVRWERPARCFAAVGRMALSNYLLQTIICTTIFYGHGFGLFGRVERSQQILIVIGIIAFQLIISPIWLRYFRFGPFEWLWRSLTYLRLQPMRVAGIS